MRRSVTSPLSLCLPWSLPAKACWSFKGWKAGGGGSSWRGRAYSWRVLLLPAPLWLWAWLGDGIYLLYIMTWYYNFGHFPDFTAPAVLERGRLATGFTVWGGRNSTCRVNVGGVLLALLLLSLAQKFYPSALKVLNSTSLWTHPSHVKATSTFFPFPPIEPSFLRSKFMLWVGECRGC